MKVSRRMVRECSIGEYFWVIGGLIGYWLGIGGRCVRLVCS